MNEIAKQEIEAKHLALVYELSRSVFIYVVNGGIIYPLAMAILIVTMPGSDPLLLDSPFTNWVDLAWWIPVIGGSGSLIIFLPRLPGAIADMRKAAHALDERRLPRPPFSSALSRRHTLGNP